MLSESISGTPRARLPMGKHVWISYAQSDGGKLALHRAGFDARTWVRLLHQPPPYRSNRL